MPVRPRPRHGGGEGCRAVPDTVVLRRQAAPDRGLRDTTHSKPNFQSPSSVDLRYGDRDVCRGGPFEGSSASRSPLTPGLESSRPPGLDPESEPPQGVHTPAVHRDPRNGAESFDDPSQSESVAPPTLGPPRKVFGRTPKDRVYSGECSGRLGAPCVRDVVLLDLASRRSRPPGDGASGGSGLGSRVDYG